MTLEGPLTLARESARSQALAGMQSFETAWTGTEMRAITYESLTGGRMPHGAWVESLVTVSLTLAGTTRDSASLRMLVIVWWLNRRLRNFRGGPMGFYDWQ